jgi:hypothetical protein
LHDGYNTIAKIKLIYFDLYTDYFGNLYVGADVDQDEGFSPSAPKS